MAIAELPRRRFTIEDYEAMVEAGILGSGDLVELLRGVIVEVSPVGRRHAGTVTWLTNALVPALDGRALLSVQSPVRLPSDSEPEPDLAIVVVRDYRTGHPSPAEVHLLIEVADTSGRQDRVVKVPVYAEAGIAEVWLVDLVADRVVVHATPIGEVYADVRSYARGESVSPAAFPDISLAVSDILGPQEPST